MIEFTIGVERAMLSPKVTIYSDEETRVMVSAVNDPVAEAWEKVSSWPAPWRLTLATRLLNSLDVSPLRHMSTGTPSDLVGAWKVPQPPSDGDVERILDEERQRKYG